MYPFVVFCYILYYSDLEHTFKFEEKKNNSKLLKTILSLSKESAICHVLLHDIFDFYECVCKQKHLNPVHLYKPMTHLNILR